jgi:hypothetical protein
VHSALTQCLQLQAHGLSWDSGQKCAPIQLGGVVLTSSEWWYRLGHSSPLTLGSGYWSSCCPPTASASRTGLWGTWIKQRLLWLSHCSHSSSVVGQSLKALCVLHIGGARGWTLGLPDFWLHPTLEAISRLAGVCGLFVSAHQM